MRPDVPCLRDCLYFTLNKSTQIISVGFKQAQYPITGPRILLIENLTLETIFNVNYVLNMFLLLPKIAVDKDTEMKPILNFKHKYQHAGTLTE